MLVGFAGEEATVKDCGVTVAMLPGQELGAAPNLSNGREVNVGTARGRPFPPGPPARQAGRLVVS